MNTEQKPRPLGGRKRRFIRVKPEKEHPIRVDLNGENFLDVTYAGDISEGGVGIHVPHEFENCEIDKPVSMVIHLPEPCSYTFSATGRIRHLTGKIFGVTFVEKSGFDRRKFRKYVMHRIKSEPFFFRLRYFLGLAN
jgi:hypothetical protein